MSKTKALHLPKALILLPVDTDGNPPDAYCMLPVHGPDIIAEMKVHLEAAEMLVKTTAAPAVQDSLGWSTSIPYRHLVARDRWALYLQRYPTVGGVGGRQDLPERFHGVSDIDTLLTLTATNILAPLDDVAQETLDEGEPVIINFPQWYTTLKEGGHYSGTDQEFWSDLLKLCVRVESDSLEIFLPVTVEVKRAGPTLELKPFQHRIMFRFSASIRHRDTERYYTHDLSVAKFIASIGDALAPML